MENIVSSCWLQPFQPFHLSPPSRFSSHQVISWFLNVSYDVLYLRISSFDVPHTEPLPEARWADSPSPGDIRDSDVTDGFSLPQIPLNCVFHVLPCLSSSDLIEIALWNFINTYWSAQFCSNFSPSQGLRICCPNSAFKVTNWEAMPGFSGIMFLRFENVQNRKGVLDKIMLSQ